MTRRLSRSAAEDQIVRKIKLPPDKKPIVEIKRRDVHRALAIGAAATVTLIVICSLAVHPHALPTPQAANAQLLGESISAEEAVTDDITKPKRETDQPWAEPEPDGDSSDTPGSTAVPQEAQDTVQVPVQENAQAKEAEPAPAAAPEQAPATDAEPEAPNEPEPEAAAEAVPYTGPRLTREGGVNTFDGHTETWYSQRVLPGTGLDIPGRHVANDGTIRDADDYIVVASDDLPKGSLVETSLGTGKVYDTFGGYNEGTGNVDIYTDW